MHSHPLPPDAQALNARFQELDKRRLKLAGDIVSNRKKVDDAQADLREAEHPENPDDAAARRRLVDAQVALQLFKNHQDALEKDAAGIDLEMASMVPALSGIFTNVSREAQARARKHFVEMISTQVHDSNSSLIEQRMFGLRTRAEQSAWVLEAACIESRDAHVKVHGAAECWKRLLLAWDDFASNFGTGTPEPAVAKP